MTGGEAWERGLNGIHQSSVPRRDNSSAVKRGDPEVKKIIDCNSGRGAKCSSANTFPLFVEAE